MPLPIDLVDEALNGERAPRADRDEVEWIIFGSFAETAKT